ncbi:MAG: nucleotidyl transferase AbiEii/AbiGii toxin family protein [Vicinamibacterales bacterium]
MTLAFLELPAAERNVYIDEAAARRGLAPVIVEKGFWVCWLLSILFQSSFRDAIAFKGGTSLSKALDVINRFPEDIDLSLAPAFLGLDEPDAMAALSKGQAGKWMERAEAKCTAVVRDALAPEIAAGLSGQLGEGKSPWLTFEVDATRTRPCCCFTSVGPLDSTS